MSQIPDEAGLSRAGFDLSVYYLYWGHRNSKISEIPGILRKFRTNFFFRKFEFKLWAKFSKNAHGSLPILS